MATIPTPTHSEFIWRFYSCQKHLYICVMAATESEARTYLPRRTLHFAARFTLDAMEILNYWNLPDELREVR
uniref:Host cell division inhibitor Icd-like protein n=1 Tax=Salmonella sp. TaxID=599 RepID=A0A482ETH1_SALSP|nr:host cell division inhibitor Icd-like protein [Salmonella sp.]QBM91503.1 hypothetical protein NNIBIDOC_00174 [Salmonella sp.]